MTTKIVLAIIEILGVMGIGALARALGYIRPSDLDRMSKFVIDFLLSALIFSSVVRDLDSSRLSELWTLPAIGLAMMVAGGLLGFVFRKPLIGGDVDMIKTFHHFCAINNYVFLPLVIIQNIWGQGAVAELFLFNLGSTVGFWTVGVVLLSDLNRPGQAKAGPSGSGSHSSSGAKTVLSNLSHLLTPSLLALVLALVASVTGLSRLIPDVVITVSSRVGSAAVPGILILVGATMYPFPRTRPVWPLVYITVLRLAILPALFIPLLCLLPLAVDVRNICCVVAIMPASASSAVITRRYGGDPKFAAAAAIVTTLISALTAPLWLYAMERLGVLTG